MQVLREKRPFFSRLVSVARPSGLDEAAAGRDRSRHIRFHAIKKCCESMRIAGYTSIKSRLLKDADLYVCESALCGCCTIYVA